MSAPYSIERLHTINDGEEFDLPDGWSFYSYKCKGDNTTVTISNSLNESITDDDSGSSFNNYSAGFEGMKLKASGGTVLIKWY